MEDRDHPASVALVHSSRFPGLPGVGPVVAGHRAQKPRLEREFQAAVAQYESGHFAEAAQRLESLVREVP